MSLSDAFCLLCPAQLEPPPSPDADSAFPTRTSPSSDAPTAVHRKTESPPTTDVIPACFPALLSTSMPPHARASSPSPRPSPRTPRRPPAAPPSSVAHRPALESELCLPPAPVSLTHARQVSPVVRGRSSGVRRGRASTARGYHPGTAGAAASREAAACWCRRTRGSPSKVRQVQYSGVAVPEQHRARRIAARMRDATAAPHGAGLRRRSSTAPLPATREPTGGLACSGPAKGSEGD